MQCIVGRVWVSCVVYWHCIGSITTMHNILHVCNAYVHNKKNLKFVQIHAVAVRVERPTLSLSLCFVNLSCLCSAVSAAHRALSHSLLCHSLSSLSCNGFGALREVVRVFIFTKSSKTINSKPKSLNKKATITVSRCTCVVRSRKYSPYAACIRVQWIYDVCIYIHIYQNNSAVQLTSVTLDHTCPD